MSEKRWCAQRVFSGERNDFSGHMCGTPATVEEGGKWWCKRHVPSNAAKKRAERNARLDAKMSEMFARSARAAALQSARDAVVEAAKLRHLAEDGFGFAACDEELNAAVDRLIALEEPRS